MGDGGVGGVGGGEVVVGVEGKGVVVVEEGTEGGEREEGGWGMGWGLEELGMGRMGDWRWVGMGGRWERGWVNWGE